MEEKSNRKDVKTIAIKIVNIIRYVIGGFICFVAITKLFDPSSFKEKIFVLFMGLIGISLMPFVYEKLLKKIKFKGISIVLPIALLIIAGLIDNSSYTYVDPIDNMEFSKIEWPRSEVAKLLPVPKSNIGNINWENSNGFAIYISETSEEDYKAYVNECWDNGFNVDYEKGDNFFRAYNSDGYYLNLELRKNDVMFISIDSPNNTSKNKTTLDENNTETNSSVVNEEKKETTKNNTTAKTDLSVIKDEKLRNNFIKACNDIKLDMSKIKELTKKDDWNNGPTYTFWYGGSQFILYAYDNGNVSSITIINKNLDKIYLEGYEPYDVKNYLLSSDNIADLKIVAETNVKKILNYPETAKFHWFESGSYSRSNDIYVVGGKFDAKNAFGVESESSFYIETKIVNGQHQVVYMVVDKKAYIGTKSLITESGRKEVAIEEEETEDNAIIIKDGIKGDYGKYDKFDGDNYLRYYVPVGKYEVEALVKNASFYIETIKLHKEDGWDTATTIRRVTLENMGDKDTIEIKKGQCISLIVHTQIKLTKIK